MNIYTFICRSKQVLCITQLQLENKKLCDFEEDIELNNLVC
jgi:hypothetical protein